MGGQGVRRSLYFVVLGSAEMTQSPLYCNMGVSALSPWAGSGTPILHLYALSEASLKILRPLELSPVGEKQHEVHPLCC